VQVIDEAPLQSFYLMRLCKHFITQTAHSVGGPLAGGPSDENGVRSVGVESRERHPPRDLFPPGWRVVPAGATPTTAYLDERLQSTSSIVLPFRNPGAYFRLL